MAKSSEKLSPDALVRSLVTCALRRTHLSREAVAEAMSVVLGHPVTRRALDSYTAESADQNRFPLQYAVAFCSAVNDWTLLREVVKVSGFAMVDARQLKLAKLGREVLAQRKRSAAIARLQEELEGVAL